MLNYWKAVLHVVMTNIITSKYRFACPRIVGVWHVINTTLVLLKKILI